MKTSEVQGKLWSTAPSDWVNYLEPTFIPMYDEVLNRLNLDEEIMLLDAGCGSGLFLSMAAATGANVHGIDAAAGLLAISRGRLPAATLLVEDLETIPFAEETFDVVTGFNSFQYAGSFEGALAEAARVTKKHGRVVIGIWGREQDCDAASVLGHVASLLPAPPPGTPGPFALSEEGKVEAICETIGLRVLDRRTVFCPWQFNSIEELEKAFLCTAPCAKAVLAVGEGAVKQAIHESASPFNLIEQVYYLRNDFTFFITEKL